MQYPDRLDQKILCSKTCYVLVFLEISSFNLKEARKFRFRDMSTIFNKGLVSYGYHSNWNLIFSGFDAMGQ